MAGYATGFPVAADGLAGRVWLTGGTFVTDEDPGWGLGVLPVVMTGRFPPLTVWRSEERARLMPKSLYMRQVKF